MKMEICGCNVMQDLSQTNHFKNFHSPSLKIQGTNLPIDELSKMVIGMMLISNTRDQLVYREVKWSFRQSSLSKTKKYDFPMTTTTWHFVWTWNVLNCCYYKKLLWQQILVYNFKKLFLTNSQLKKVWMRYLLKCIEWAVAQLTLGLSWLCGSVDAFNLRSPQFESDKWQDYMK